METGGSPNHLTVDRGAQATFGRSNLTADVGALKLRVPEDLAPLVTVRQGERGRQQHLMHDSPFQLEGSLPCHFV